GGLTVLGNDVTLLFDLDGTLVDSALGIRKSLQKGLESLGAALPQDAQLDAVIGQTFNQIWPALTGSQDPQIWEKATQAFREYYDSGAWQQVQWMPGMEALLQRLSSKHRMGIASMKPSAAVEKVLKHLE